MTAIGLCAYCECPLYAPHATLIDPYDSVSHFCENCWAEREAWSPPTEVFIPLTADLQGQDR